MSKQHITKKTIESIGINLKGKKMRTFIIHINEMLEERIGYEIVSYLNDEKLQTLLMLKESASDVKVGEWLSEQVPDLQEIAQDEIDILIGEIAENSNEINRTATYIVKRTETELR